MFVSFICLISSGETRLFSFAEIARLSSPAVAAESMLLSVNLLRLLFKSLMAISFPPGRPAEFSLEFHGLNPGIPGLAYLKARL